MGARGLQSLKITKTLEIRQNHRNRSKSLHRSHWALEIAARACCKAAKPLKIAAQACCKAAKPLKIVARACPEAREALKIAARAWCTAAKALQITD